MKQILERILTLFFVQHKPGTGNSSGKLSGFQFARAYRLLRITVTRYLRDFFMISLGVLSATFGLQGFILPNHLIDGGATGISLLLIEKIESDAFVVMNSVKDTRGGMIKKRPLKH